MTVKGLKSLIRIKKISVIRLWCADNVEETPGHISNPAVKLNRAEGSAREI